LATIEARSARENEDMAGSAVGGEYHNRFRACLTGHLAIR
jgi:hypothetical protein